MRRRTKTYDGNRANRLNHRKVKKRKRKRRYIVGPVVQLHHDQYQPDSGEIVGETVGHLFKAEHKHLTMLRRQTHNISRWFIECLERWLERAKDKHLVGEHTFRDLDREITSLPEGQTYHCERCGAGFMVRSNCTKHQKICYKRSESQWIGNS